MDKRLKTFVALLFYTKQKLFLFSIEREVILGNLKCSDIQPTLALGLEQSGEKFDVFLAF